MPDDVLTRPVVVFAKVSLLIDIQSEPNPLRKAQTTAGMRGSFSGPLSGTVCSDPTLFGRTENCYFTFLAGKQHDTVGAFSVRESRQAAIKEIKNRLEESMAFHWWEMWLCTCRSRIKIITDSATWAANGTAGAEIISVFVPLRLHVSIARQAGPQMGLLVSRVDLL
ncbi:hypothetical protein PCH_Pc21g15860 [Penicillium rubens Wisconsin 54-1255]|uniref:Uncharacterized protein n=1 Tax=Penicillium rubens (strain ATCC 28089 / DSM 1075 / NRRL 1951 / Wisconsin 54-1255) TaxID=500485 RepID=B6HK82_PENRW|nr:hypothetical protein PCH_Pc21g15860 [Penicillium rubens Wisconsin 54-1255]